jgi:hypothetical protein
MDAITADLLGQSAVQGHMQGMSNIALAGQNAAQGLTVVNTALIQAQGSVSDDAGLIASLQTASRAPIQGSNDLPKA